MPGNLDINILHINILHFTSNHYNTLTEFQIHPQFTYVNSVVFNLQVLIQGPPVSWQQKHKLRGILFRNVCALYFTLFLQQSNLEHQELAGWTMCTASWRPGGAVLQEHSVSIRKGRSQTLKFHCYVSLNEFTKNRCWYSFIKSFLPQLLFSLKHTNPKQIKAKFPV